MSTLVIWDDSRYTKEEQLTFHKIARYLGLLITVEVRDPETRVYIFRGDVEAKDFDQALYENGVRSVTVKERKPYIAPYYEVTIIVNE